ncbi:citrate lyase holo-[acyl-carrier protein] synthase [Geoalkalibacter sp.]|uniref:citrate lyase holo-[acyl-carrier protein] synthase n=1 Tax=Geoalkalibacter sp. TaxID=3041440 RepID=UPI00272DC933|nr:citrate lyase holo-[acyl-carrier protein] synthase [Geoalkalibacter sp.]
MSCAALRTSLLEARETRQGSIDQALAAGRPWVACLSLALPGADKNPPGADALFSWGRARLQGEIPGFTLLAAWDDALGPWLVLDGSEDPVSAKRAGVAVENLHPAARLLDVDVYLAAGEPLGRASLGLEERPCLLCRRPARTCIRLKRHEPETIMRAAHALIACFSPASPG